MYIGSPSTGWSVQTSSNLFSTSTVDVLGPLTLVLGLSSAPHRNVLLLGTKAFIRSPPITHSAGTEGFTEDYAVVKLDSSKIEKAFKGNVIGIGAF
jgi:hypothetical protein